MIYWWWMLKVAAQMTLTYWNVGDLAWVHRSELRPAGCDWHQWQESCLLWAKRLGKWFISFYCMWSKAICKSMSTNVCCGWALQRLHFYISPSPLVSASLGALTILGKWQFSLICGSPEPPGRPWNEFISPQWHANDQCYNNITTCHHHLCILKREEMCSSCHFLILSLTWKDNDFQHKSLKRFRSINTYFAQFFFTDFTRIFISLSKVLV